MSVRPSPRLIAASPEPAARVAARLRGCAAARLRGCEKNAPRSRHRGNLNRIDQATCAANIPPGRWQHSHSPAAVGASGDRKPSTEQDPHNQNVSPGRPEPRPIDSFTHRLYRMAPAIGLEPITGRMRGRFASASARGMPGWTGTCVNSEKRARAPLLGIGRSVMGRKVRIGLLLTAAACLVAVLVDWAVMELNSEATQAGIEAEQAGLRQSRPALRQSRPVSRQSRLLSRQSRPASRKSKKILEEPRTRPRNHTTKAEAAGGRPSPHRQGKPVVSISFRAPGLRPLRDSGDAINGEPANSWSRTQITRSRAARPLIFCARATMHFGGAARGCHCWVEHAQRSASNADEQCVGQASVVNGRPFSESAEQTPTPLSGAATRLPTARRAHAHDVPGGGGSADSVSGPSMAGVAAEAGSCAFIRASSSSTSWPAVRASS